MVILMINRNGPNSSGTESIDQVQVIRHGEQSDCIVVRRMVRPPISTIRSRILTRDCEIWASPAHLRVLGNEFSLDGKGEDGFAKVGRCDGVGRVEEEVEVRRGGRIRKAGERGAGKSGVPGVAFLLLRLEPITQSHQLIHLRHNPLLLGKGREGEPATGRDCFVKYGFSLCQLPGLQPAF